MMNITRLFVTTILTVAIFSTMSLLNAAETPNLDEQHINGGVSRPCISTTHDENSRLFIFRQHLIQWCVWEVEKIGNFAGNDSAVDDIGPSGNSGAGESGVVAPLICQLHHIWESSVG